MVYNGDTTSCTYIHHEKGDELKISGLGTILLFTRETDYILTKYNLQKSFKYELRLPD